MKRGGDGGRDDMKRGDEGGMHGMKRDGGRVRRDGHRDQENREVKLEVQEEKNARRSLLERQEVKNVE